MRAAGRGRILSAVKPFLVLDCYLDDIGATRLFTPLPDGSPVEALQVVRDPLPSDPSAYAGLLITGSAASVLDPEVAWLPGLEAFVSAALERDVPILGVCFGHQLVAKLLWGPDALRLSPTPEVGWFEIERTAEDALLEGFPRRFTTFLSHFDEVLEAPAGLECVARSERCGVQAFQVPGRPVWCVQFHAEMDAEETERLLRQRLAKNPHLGDPEQALERRVDSSALKRRLFENFLRLARAHTPA